MARLVGTRSDSIVTEVERLLRDRKAYASMQVAENPYGDGMLPRPSSTISRPRSPDATSGFANTAATR